MPSSLSLADAIIHSSPRDIADWPETLRITHVDQAPGRGFRLTFDRRVPDEWKWPSNPAVPSENFQYTVWAFVEIGGVWHGAGFIQMWQGRPMDGGQLPALFTVGDDGVPGYVNWWGDVRNLWGEMSAYRPQPGDKIGLMVSAGNGRLCTDVTSVRERSTVILVPVNANDLVSVDTDLVPDPPHTDDPDMDLLARRVGALAEASEVRHRQLMDQVTDVANLIRTLTRR